MPSNNFAPLSKNYCTFLVQNISNPQKVVNIFNHPIYHGTTRDIMAIPGVGEADIRASLLKGELRVKLRAKEIIILKSDIDLIQFSNEQKDFLTNAGITYGTKITQDQAEGVFAGGGTGITYLIRQQIVPIGIKNGINRVYNTPELFLDGDYNNNTFRITVNFNGRLLLPSIDYDISKTSISMGIGFDTITMKSVAPPTNSQLYVDYTVAIS